MERQTLTYLNPRFAILYIDLARPQTLLKAQLTIKSRHKNYYHLFNLSSHQLTSSNLGVIPQTSFKWRGIPFSITQCIKLLCSIESFQLKNNANAAIIGVGDQNCYKFAIFVAELYWSLMGRKLQKCKSHSAIVQFMKIYKSIDIKTPPVKIIDSFSFKDSQSTFIPLIKIYTESRHNNFQQIYCQSPDNDLINYYIDRKSPIGKGIGMKYCQKRPQTKYFGKPIIVAGDIKIQIFSFEKIKLEYEFTCGFNTKALQYDQSLIVLQKNDLYDVADERKIISEHEILIEISDYCQKCKDQARCSQCLQIVKKLGSTYTSAQIQLEKVNRNRSQEQITRILG